ncbi:MAG: ArsR family transcriptional regulator, partial [Promethearchaeota archaeon]
MATDKITTLLENQLRVLGQKIRLEILKQLYLAERALSFSELQQKMGVDPSQINLSYHLNSLKDVNLIQAVSKKYTLTITGEEILKKIWAIEQILAEQDQERLIRTSQYYTESFDLSRIKNYLMREADMNSFLAEKISTIVKKRLSKTKIKYLTTPLIREYINGILIEENCEEYRHKLTRLGVPPYDTSKIFKDPTISPDIFIESLGGEVSEQYLLLNLLPRDLADLYLSKKLIILHLNTWALKPLSIILNASQMLNLVRKQNLNGGFNNPSRSGITFSYNILKFVEILNKIGQYFSNDILLGNFDEIFNIYNGNDEQIPDYLDLLYSHLSYLNNQLKSHIDLAFNSEQNSEIPFKLIEKINQELKLHAKSYVWTPTLYFNYSKLRNADRFLNFVKTMKNYNPKNYNFYKNEKALLKSLLVSSNFDGKEMKDFSIILDKIFINLYEIALESNQNDEKFFDILEARLNSCFELFSYKQKFMKRRFENSNQMKTVFDTFLGKKSDNWLSESWKSISFLGLNSSVKVHCGLELDRIKTSEDFALNIIHFMKERISEKNHITNDNYCLTAPYEGKYINFPQNYPHKANIEGFGQQAHKLIREASNLNLKKRIQFFQRINQYIDGGLLFEFAVNSKERERI